MLFTSSARIRRLLARAARSGTAPQSCGLEPLENRTLFAATFAAPVPFEVPANDNGLLQAPVVGDFDEDGRLDLIVVDAYDVQSGVTPTDGQIAFAKGNGAGTFQVGAAIPIGVFTSDAKAGDFNGDGNIDLIVVNGLSDNALVVLGNGNGTFRTPISVPVGQEPLPIAVADFNGDGRDDAAVGNRTDNSVTILFGAASTTAPLGNAATLVAGTDPASLAVADVNRDGRLDLLIGNAGDSNTGGILTVRPGNGDGTFGTAIDTSGPRGVTGVGDFNGDGEVDVAVSVSPSGSASVLRGNGDGTFQVANPPEGGFIALVADYDVDGKLDIASAGTTDNLVRVLTGRGDGTFNAFDGFPANQPGAGAVGDFNGDGKPDIAVSGLSSTGRLIDVLLNTTGNPGATGADLTGSILRAKIPPAAVGGDTKGNVVVRVVNSGTEQIRGPVGVALYASSDANLDGGDTLIIENTKNLRIKAGKAKNVRVRFTFPGSVPDGAYNLIARVDNSSAIAESNEQNNIAVVSDTVVIAAPFTDLSVTFRDQPPATLRAGKKQTVKLAVENLGNIPAKGSINVRVIASTTQTNGGEETDLVPLTRRVNIKPGKTARVNVKAAIPPTLAGSRFILASITPTGSLIDANADNNLIASAGQVTIT